MIVITLGTIPYPLDRLVLWVDALISQGVIKDKLFVQHGVTDVSVLQKYQQVQCVPIVKREEMARLISESSLVIAHAGQGTTRELAMSSLSFVVVPRLTRLGEHIDDHQLQFARGVSKLGVVYCETFEELRDAVLNPPKPLQRSLLAGPKLADYLLKVYPPSAPE